MGLLLLVYFLPQGAWHPLQASCTNDLPHSWLTRDNRNVARSFPGYAVPSSFSLVRSAVMCLRGARSSLHHPARSMEEVPLDLAIQEGRVPIVV